MTPSRLPHYIEHVRSECTSLESRIDSLALAVAASRGDLRRVLEARRAVAQSRLACERECLAIYERALSDITRPA
jgi:hypothetical protein